MNHMNLRYTKQPMFYIGFSVNSQIKQYLITNDRQLPFGARDLPHGILIGLNFLWWRLFIENNPSGIKLDFRKKIST